MFFSISFSSSWGVALLKKDPRQHILLQVNKPPHIKKTSCIFHYKYLIQTTFMNVLFCAVVNSFFLVENIHREIGTFLHGKIIHAGIIN